VLKVLLLSLSLIFILVGCAGAPTAPAPKSYMERQDDAVTLACPTEYHTMADIKAHDLCKRETEIKFSQTDPEMIERNSKMDVSQRRYHFAQDKCYKADSHTSEFTDCLRSAEKEFDRTDKEAVETARVAKNRSSRAESKRIAAINDFAQKNPKYAGFAVLAKEKKFAVGMPTALLELSSVQVCKTNNTVNQFGRSAQLVLCDGGGYIYTENGFVTAFQN
jgi:hypothetical protein